MGAGDVIVEIVDANATAIDTAIINLRVTANDHWMMSSIGDGQQVLIAHIEEA